MKPRIFTTIAVLLTLGQMPVLAHSGSKPEHPLLTCARAFGAKGSPVEPRTVFGVEQEPQSVFVSRTNLPGDPLGGEDGKYIDLIPIGMGAYAYAVIGDDGRITTKAGIGGPPGGSMPFPAGELVLLTVSPVALPEEEKGLPIIEVLSKYRHQVTRGKGSFEHNSAEPIGLKLEISPKVSCETLKATLAGMLRPATPVEVAAWEKEHPDIVNGTIVPSLREGMTVAEVEKILGTPERTAVIGGKMIYFYPKMKVTFTGGKVTGID